MQNHLFSALTLLALLLTGGCDTTTDPTADLEKAVLEGFLYAHAPIDSIRISNLLTFGTDSSITPATDDLNVFLSWNSEEYLLVPNDSLPGYYHYDGTALQILEGETYTISFDYAGKIVSATTTIPQIPVGLSIENETIEIEQVVFGQGPPTGGNGFNEDPTAIYWTNPEGNFYFVVVENIEENPQSIFVNLPFERNFSFVTEPTSNDFYVLEPRILEQYGTHRAVVYRVNQEYVDLYENATQDSRSLNEPLSNVENGLGVFTGFSSDTLYFEVKQP